MASTIRGTKKSGLQDLLDMDGEMQHCSYIKSNRQDVFYHQVSIDQPIGEASQYRDLIHLLYSADENTEFNFFINSPGGNLMAALAIIEGIRATRGLVRAIVIGECHSAASLITMACHEVVVTDSAHSLVHTASYGTDGNTHMVQNHVNFSTKLINRILEEAYAGFLTQNEIHDIERGIEMWMGAEEIRERMNARRQHIVDQKEASEALAAKSVPKRGRKQKVVEESDD